MNIEDSMLDANSQEPARPPQTDAGLKAAGGKQDAPCGGEDLNQSDKESQATASVSSSVGVDGNANIKGPVVGGVGGSAEINNADTINNITNRKKKTYNRYKIKMYQSGPKEEGQQAKAENRLLSLIGPLPARRSYVLQVVPEGLEVRLQELKEHRVLIISCAHDQIGTAAVYAICDKLPVDEESKRQLEFDLAGLEDDDCAFTLFTEERADAQSDIAIFVNLFSNSAELFLNSLIRNAGRANTIEDALKRNRYFVVCLVKPEHVKNRLRRSLYPCWDISVLSNLLGDQYANLESQVVSQRERGKWDKDDEEFHRQIEDLVSSRKLAEEVEKIARSETEIADHPDEAIDTASLFIGDKGIKDTVVYTAAFFPALNPGEFKQVVSALLGERTVTITTTLHRQVAGGAVEPFEAQKEVRLSQLWQEQSDKLIKEAKLKAFQAKDATRTIGFSITNLKEQARSYIESEYSFYLEDQSQAVQKQGLIFHRSASVREGAFRIIIEMALAYPEHFNPDWIVAAIRQFRNDLFPAAGVGRAESPPPFSMPGSPANRLQWGYARIAELFSKMLEHPQLQSLANDLLDRLMGLQFFDSVLQISRRLQFAPEFKLLHWLKQLLERGDERARQQTHLFLLQRLTKMGPDIYDGLRSLEPWLPPADRPVNTYSKANLCALELLLDYCLEVTMTSDVKQHGLQPTRHPLFISKPLEQLKSDLELLCRWLLHPGMKAAWGDPAHYLAAILLANWTIILIGPNPQEASDRAKTTTIGEALCFADQPPAGAAQGLDNGFILGLFLRLAAVAVSQYQPRNPAQLEEMGESWADLAKGTTEAIKDLPYAGNYRPAAICRRNLVNDLARQFKALVREARTQRNAGVD